MNADSTSPAVRQAVLLILLATFILAACALFAPTSGGPLSSTPVADVASGPPSMGWLAYIGADGNVYLLRGDFSQKRQVTADADAAMEGIGRSYHRLSWSPDGRLAYAAVERLETGARSQIYVARSDGTDPRLVASDDEDFVIYLHWAPSGCARQDGCLRLAYLINEGERIGMRLMQSTAGGVEDRLVAAGRPTYFSWSPDGERLLLHTGGPQVRDSANRLEIYAAPASEHVVLDLQAGEFAAPAWGPDGKRALVTLKDGSANVLSLLTFSGEDSVAARPLASSSAELVFTWAPNGERIAFAERDRLDGRAYGPVQVYDLDSGQIRRITPESLPLLGFFWSPDGDRIGYLTRLQVQERLWMQWRVVEVESQADAGFAAFQPSPAMAFMINSFNQYAQSDRFWSPDGRYLVFAERDEALVDRIWLVDTWNKGNRDAIFVDRGTFGIWSFHE